MYGAAVSSDHVESPIREEAIAEFRASLRGPLVLPGEPDYEELRLVHNGLIDRSPAMIVRPTGNADVIAAVNFARDQKMVVSVRGGAHNVAGSGTNDGGLVIELSLMKGVHVDSVNRTVRAQGGATWGDVDRETQIFGLATPGGLISTTGVGGLSIHGGCGWLRRKYGYSVDNILSVDIVTADGQLRTANATENPDLYWAVRGAGSNFGVITSFVFKLHPVGPMVFAALPFYDPDDAEKILPAWREFMAFAPDEVSGQALFWMIQPRNGFPVELWGRSVLILPTVHCGDPADNERILRPLRELAEPIIDASGVMPYAMLQGAFDAGFPRGRYYYWKSLYLNSFDDDVMAAVIDLARNRPSPLTLLALWHIEGGAASRVPADATAFGRRDHPYLLSIDTTWTDAAETERHIAWTREHWADMQRFGSGAIYLNFAGFGEEKEALVRASYGENYDRLARLKFTYDPDNLFRMNQNIKPTVAVTDIIRQPAAATDTTILADSASPRMEAPPEA